MGKLKCNGISAIIKVLISGYGIQTSILLFKDKTLGSHADTREFTFFISLGALGIIIHFYQMYLYQ